ncbi:leucine-rich repeat protein [Pelomyxa schiedti]|nr:leucine-rich repeat protein [Pelomyxa schiedti]
MCGARNRAGDSEESKEKFQVDQEEMRRGSSFGSHRSPSSWLPPTDRNNGSHVADAGPPNLAEASRLIHQAQNENSRKLELYNLRLRRLPEGVLDLTQLVCLSLNCNAMEEIPWCIVRLTQLSRLYLVNNRISEIPVVLCNMTNLQELYLSSNNLTELPAEIGNLTNLRELSACDNRITVVPPSISRLQKLSLLILATNQLKRLPITSIGLLTNLRGLYVDENPLPKELLPTLRRCSSLDIVQRIYHRNTTALIMMIGWKRGTATFSELPLSVLHAIIDLAFPNCPPLC